MKRTMNQGAVEQGTILIVDDTPEMLDVLITLVEQIGFKPLVAQSGEEALERIEHVQPDLILLDILMCDMDGFEVCRRLKARDDTRDIPVIFMTVLSDTVDKIKGFELGAVDYITKPFQDEEVLARIRAHLTIHHLQQQLEEANKTLEQRVSERTTELEETNKALQAEITERKLVEEALKASYEQLRNLPAHLQAVREEERTTIAREIHDELGQALVALKMDLSWLKRRFTDDQPGLLEKANTMEKLIDSILQVVKRIVTALRPGLLDDLGLSAAIEWQAEEFQQRTGIQCDVLIDPEEINLNDDVSTAVIRIYQETLTNVVRHAHATQVHVLLRETENSLLLEVRDNGKGITLQQISDPKSFGLIGIRERAQFLGGQVTFQGIPNTGTTVTVSIPLNNS